MSFFKRLFSSDKKQSLDEGLARSKRGVLEKITRAVSGKKDIDADVLEELEEALITSDMGVRTTTEIIRRIEDRTSRDAAASVDKLLPMLREEIVQMLETHRGDQPTDLALPETEGPYVFLIVGVNGVGKTTTIGKLCHQFAGRGLKVTVGAADTFRAAAVDQLRVWADRTGASFVAQGQDADPAAVAFDAVQSAVAKNHDVVLVDTAGRLHNKKHLMDELSKIKRVMQKVAPGVPHEVLLVLDGSTGQNAIEQARQFTAATEVSGLVLTKLDGTARGGVVIGIAEEFSIPVRFVGVGEQPEDLQVFNAMEFVDSLLPTSFGEDTPTA
ncbi:MAG: signal recognition particle-docking protein FtsY [Crocinitomicaceae bacterium TMED114]|nr:MAG: signal recognition particle-docking protein FtsY [Crocinitomicaceae bacterium TMED114]